MYVQSDTLLLTDVLENFPNLCLELHELDLAKFPLALRLAWKAALKKTKGKFDLGYAINGRRK